MSTLDYPTLLLVLIIFTTVTTLLLLSAVLSADALAEQRLWASGSVAASLGLVVGALTGMPAIVHAGISYALIGLGLALLLRGLRQFFGHGMSWNWVAAITLGAFVLPAYYALVEPDKAMRVMLSGLYLGVICWICAYTLLRGLEGRNRGVMWASAGGFVVIGSVIFFRGVYLLVLPAAASAQTVETIAAISVLATAVAQVMVTFGLIMLVSQRYADKLSRLTMVDGLTGALNRVGMEHMGERVLMRARQSQRSVSLALVDADLFKAINDTHGHPAGDQVLMHLANMLAAQVRPGDLVIRYGGEEFVLLLDGSSLADASLAAERLRKLIEESIVRTTEGADIRYRVSIGVSCSDKTGYALAELVSRADAALYRAKQEGRNRVCAD